MRCHCLRGELAQASVAVDFDFTDWSEENHVLLPAAAYNGNRFASRRIAYSPKLNDPRDIGPDQPTIVTDVPRLNAGDGPSRIQERSASLATPAMGFQSPATGRGFLLLTQYANELGDLGFGIEESLQRDRATLSVASPVVREVYNYRICDLQHPSQDQPHDFRGGDVVRFQVRLHAFDAPAVQSLFDTLATGRKELMPRRSIPGTLPYSACVDLLEEKFNHENYIPEHGYYAVGLRENYMQDWQIGWTGGMISTLPLLFAGSPTTRENVRRNFDWLFPAGISPSGFFWDSCSNGTQWIGGDLRKPHTHQWHLIRKSGDGVYYIIKQFELMRQLGCGVESKWEAGTRRVCDAMVRLWRENGQFGQFVDSQTGRIIVGGSTSGAIVPAALALAARYFQHPDYLRVAYDAGEYFYAQFTTRGLSCGGPADALQNPDSESSYALVESYLALWEAGGDAVWLKRAGEQARQFASWVVSEDYPFPAKSTFGRMGIRSTGAVYANTQNKHAAPGICTFSGLGLLRLFRATGDRFYLDLLGDIARGLPQYLPHPLKPVGDARFGHMSERVNLTDWEGADRVGEIIHHTTWAETALMLTAIEIPGLYVQPDKSLVVAFDSIDAWIESESAHELVIGLCNPTPVAARVRLFCESVAAAALPLPEKYMLNARVIPLAPHEITQLRLSK